MKSNATSLFDRMGGQETVLKAVEILYLRILSDEQLKPFFRGADRRKLKIKKRMFMKSIGEQMRTDKRSWTGCFSKSLPLRVLI